MENFHLNWLHVTLYFIKSLLGKYNKLICKLLIVNNIFVIMLTLSNKKGPFALAGVDQWIECQLANQRVATSIPSQGTCLGCRPSPQ